MATVVTEVNQNDFQIRNKAIRPTKEGLVEEYRYFLSQRIIQGLYQDKLISKAEFQHFQRIFQRKYRPHLLCLME